MNPPLPASARRGPFAFLANYSIHLAFLSLVAMLVIALGLSGGGGRSGMLSDILLGCILAVVNAFLGYVFVEKAFRYDSNLFLFISLSGMALRFFLMIASIGIILLLRIADAGSFVGAFMALYTMGLIAEVLHINTRTERLRTERLRAAKARARA